MPLYVVCLFVCLFVSQNKIKKHCQIAIHVRLDIFVSNIRNISQLRDLSEEVQG